MFSHDSPFYATLDIRSLFSILGLNLLPHIPLILGSSTFRSVKVAKSRFSREEAARDVRNGRRFEPLWIIQSAQNTYTEATQSTVAADYREPSSGWGNESHGIKLMPTCLAAKLRLVLRARVMTSVRAGRTPRVRTSSPAAYAFPIACKVEKLRAPTMLDRPAR